MKVLHIATSDITGGAARAAYRLHQGLSFYGIDSGMLVEKKKSDDEAVIRYSASSDMSSRIRSIFRNQLIKWNFNIYKKYRPSGLEIFSDARTRYDDSFKKYLAGNDVINLHWTAGFLDYDAFFPQLDSDKPVVWTLHDMNPFTGGCHYSGNCRRFMNSCGACPQLGSSKESDLSRSSWIIKKDALSQSKGKLLHIVTPSKWLAKQARESALFAHLPISIIPYGIDTDLFHPRDTSSFRDTLGIPHDATVIGFVADSTANKRKGLYYLKEAVEKINNKNIFLVSVGKSSPNISKQINHIHLGCIESDRLLSMAYSLFDVYVCASVEDNLPNTVIESLACGTPVVGFSIGGMPDMVVSGRTGLLAADVDSKSLAICLNEILADKKLLEAMAVQCREKALIDYALLTQADNYTNLYASLL